MLPSFPLARRFLEGSSFGLPRRSVDAVYMGFRKFLNHPSPFGHVFAEKSKTESFRCSFDFCWIDLCAAGGDLGYSVVIFSAGAVLCMSTLFLRRKAREDLAAQEMMAVERTETFG